MNASDIIQIVLAFLTLIGVIVALITTSWSIRAQNKQSLFEKRLEAFVLCKTFYDLIDENIKHLDIKPEKNYPLTISLEFSWITNTDYFEKSPRLIDDVYNEEYRYKFLQKLEDLNALSEKCSLLFKGTNGTLLQAFIASYRDTIRSMYGYQVLVEKMRDDPIEKMKKDAVAAGVTKMTPKTAKQLCESYGEPERQKELLKKIDNLKAAFNTLKKSNSLKKIKKQLIL
ncbi:hypothetical protein IIY68_03965 [Candidatus Saccharibacteria bacterium]|nr:hypothetical protein [Candidatus Saccharibacteria bacterium]